MRHFVHILTFLICTIATFKVNSQQLQSKISNLKSIRIIVQNRDTAGSTWRSYTLVNKKIMIYEKPFPKSNFKEHIHTQRKFNFNSFKDRISNLNIDTLSSKYYNKCLDSSLGKRYVLEFSTGNSLKVISIHEYYLDIIDTLIEHINASLPIYMNLEYFPSTKIQTCK